MNDVAYLWHAGQHRCLLHLDSVTLGVDSQACPNYLKQLVYNGFAISPGKREKLS